MKVCMLKLCLSKLKQASVAKSILKLVLLADKTPGLSVTFGIPPFSQKALVASNVDGHTFLHL